MTRINWPTLADITDSVIAYRDKLQTYDPKDIADGLPSSSGDIRLHVADDGSSPAIHTGDASYDPKDHRGYWGASSITPDMTDDECAGVADDLILAASIEELSRKPAEDDIGCR
jgi:hypothetical protein